MTPEEQKKKKGSDILQDAVNANVAAINESTDKSVKVLADEGQKQVAGIEAAQQAQAAAESDAMREYKARMEAGHTAFADIIAGERRAMEEQQKAAEAQVKADYDAAKYTGLTELAAGVANLIGVGQLNAVSQVYKSYSQDWMRKADMDMREHRARVDNMRNRLNALRQQQINLQMGDAAKALELAHRDAERNYGNAIALGQARYGAAVNPVQAEAQGRERAAQAELQGAQAVNNARMQEAHLGLQQQAQQRAKEQFEATMRSKGFNPDGSVNPDAMSIVSAVSRASSGTDKRNPFPVIDQKTGKVNTANLTDKEREDVFTIAKAAIGMDLGEQEAKRLERELQMAGDNERKRNEVLQNWIGKSPYMAEVLRNMDALYRGEHGTQETTPAEPPKVEATKPTKPAQTPAAQDTTKPAKKKGDMSENDFMNWINQ